jgi:putative transposase
MPFGSWQTLQASGVQISMAAAGDPRQNGYAEYVIRTIKEEEIALAEYRDFAKALVQIRQFIGDVYRTRLWPFSPQPDGRKMAAR